jgi:methionyl-tRNA formyltransferase
MKGKDLRIIFLGTPDFAAHSLSKLIDDSYTVVAVVTAPDKPAGRGMQLQQSAVKKVAMAHHIPVLQPEKLKNTEFLTQLASFKADLQVVIAFRMLPQTVWNMPPMGTVNLHASLLPDYRGAAPINWAIINGEKQTGITTFKLKHEIDTGDLLLQDSVPITPSMTAGDLHDVLMLKGADLIVRTIEGLANNSINPMPQADRPGKQAPKLFSSDCEINWEQYGQATVNKIHGLSPFPGANCIFNGKTLKLFKASFEHEKHTLKVGTPVIEKNKSLKFATADGFVHIHELQLAGKKRMKTTDFLIGYNLSKD